MWGSDTDKREFGAIFSLWYAEDQAVRDRKAAVARLRPLADRGYAPAQFALAQAYFDGHGVRRDYSLGYRHCLASAEQNYPAAACQIGAFYIGVSPKFGVCEYDPAQGVQWFRRAAEEGNAAAQFNLATAYSTGNGVEQDERESWIWASLAVHCSRVRCRPAEVLRDQVATKLDTARWEDAKERLSALKARLPLPWSEHLEYWKGLRGQGL